MDYGKLCRVADAAQTSKEDHKKKIQDAIERRRASREEARKKVEDSESKKYETFKVTDSYKDLRKKIKDNLMETEDTEAAIQAALEALAEAPAEQVLAATIEVLAEAIDVLQVEDPEIEENEEIQVEDPEEE